MNRRALAPLLLALLTFGPFIGALVLYYGPWGLDWLPRLSGSRELIEPPVELPDAWRAQGPDGRWALIYAQTAPCDAVCTERLARLLAVQLRLGRDKDEVGRALWSVGGPPAGEDPELVHRDLASPEGAKIVTALGAEPLAAGRVYVADPDGRVILRYPVDVPQSELLRDLKRLISVSGAG